ncbi:hypothetical protein L1049_002265 [Liquidambar formosana]|uniref:Alginate lyase 2 domain-containing protein n=1 Tax=Liquidambar formosana TaxID=63359 RepID=A0AAP0NFA5_LIQFO
MKAYVLSLQQQGGWASRVFQVNMSIAILPMSAEFNWNLATVGLIKSSFFWGYLLTQADTVGGKRVLAFGVIWWSIATALTPVAAKIGLPFLLVVRAFMGISEGVAMPAMNNILSKWIPVAKRNKKSTKTGGAVEVPRISQTIILRQLTWLNPTRLLDSVRDLGPRKIITEVMMMTSTKAEMDGTKTLKSRKFVPQASKVTFDKSSPRDRQNQEKQHCYSKKKSNFDIQRPYDVPVNQRYSFVNGIRKLWVFSTDKPHTPTSKTAPRTEIRIQGYDYSSGVWQFEGYGYVPKGTSGVCVMQVFGSSPPHATTLVLSVYNGSLSSYRDPVLVPNIYNKWFRLNVIHDVDSSKVKVFINGVLKFQAEGRGGSSHYFKFGVYAQDDDSHCMESRWKGIKVLKKE